MTTEAGKRLLSALRSHAPWFLGGSQDAETTFIAAIEVEAVVAERARIAEAVGGLDDDCHSHSGLMCDRDDQGRCTSINRAAVLAIVNPKEADR